jgi:CMD domain protein
MTDVPPDVIDYLADIPVGSPLATIRDGRMQARENAQNSFTALFRTSATADMARDERFALATFVTALHGDERAASFYAGGLAPALAQAIGAEADRGRGRGPYGHYPSPALAAENAAGPNFAVSHGNARAIGPRLVAAMEHAHMLVFHPRDADRAGLARLLDAGWSTTGVVTLSQLVAFLAFQLRVVAGLRTLAANMGGN